MFSNSIIHEENTKENHNRDVFLYHNQTVGTWQLLPQISLKIPIRLRSYIKQSKDCSIKTLQSWLKNKLGYHLVFNPHLGVSSCDETIFLRVSYIASKTSCYFVEVFI